MSVSASSDTEKVLWRGSEVLHFYGAEVSAYHPCLRSGVFPALRAVYRLPQGKLKARAPAGRGGWGGGRPGVRVEEGGAPARGAQNATMTTAGGQIVPHARTHTDAENLSLK